MKIDHFGIVVKDIKKSAKLYQKTFNLKRQTEVILDQTQRVYVQFFETENKQRIELIQPTNKTSPSYHALLKGGGANHICFITLDIKKELIILKREKAIIVCPPIRGTGHNGKLIAFAVHPLLGLIELVEQK